MSLLSPASPVRLSELTNGFGHFTSDLYQQYVQSTNENVIFSPVSILNVLALLSTAANGVTYEQMNKSLYLNDNKTFTANQFYEISRFLKNNDEKTSLLIANRIYANERYTLNKTFASIAANKFSCGIEALNFDKNTQAARNINDFVAEKTNSQIRDFIQPDRIQKDISVILINAIYFKGSWKQKFNKTLTSAGNFYVNKNKTVQVDFMRMKSGFRYIDYEFELSASVLEIEYTNSKYSFIILLPRSRTGLSQLERRLKKCNLTRLSQDLVSRYPLEVDVRIPKFKVGMAIELDDLLKKLGMVDIFDPHKADLQEILDTNQQLYVSDAHHTAFIDVNEDGSEAAAASSLFLNLLCAQPIENLFHADHPFVYYIWNKEIEAAVFIGRITKFD
ncbi:antichymotrypsin-2-like [Contarinia nasturtii]|uniref:antichymotrypsin-2-like n=1 Tax=Contarinia nasturtii TaxID=265458 RepID=UPI0012D3B4DB|nr:antichymotrypsin-2-like [Contarinia nasturtii]